MNSLLKLGLALGSPLLLPLRSLALLSCTDSRRGRSPPFLVLRPLPSLLPPPLLLPITMVLKYSKLPQFSVLDSPYTAGELTNEVAIVCHHQHCAIERGQGSLENLLEQIFFDLREEFQEEFEEL